jgi:hypothetical protein
VVSPGRRSLILKTEGQSLLTATAGSGTSLRCRRSCPPTPKLLTEELFTANEHTLILECVWRISAQGGTWSRVVSLNWQKSHVPCRVSLPSHSVVIKDDGHACGALQPQRGISSPVRPHSRIPPENDRWDRVPPFTRLSLDGSPRLAMHHRSAPARLHALPAGPWVGSQHRQSWVQETGGSAPSHETDADS